MDKVKITELRELHLHIDKEIAKRSIPLKQQKRMANLIKRMATDAYALGKHGSIEVELSEEA